jgi:hypothetical protein
MPLIYAAIIYAYLPQILTVIFAICALALIIQFMRWRAKRIDAYKLVRANYEAELRWRADNQHQWVQRGDPLGMYGDYTPATLPLTRPMLDPYQLFGGK